MDIREDLKTRIFLLKLSRKELAIQLRMSYNLFTHRLNGFSNFSYEDERKLRIILDEAEKTQEGKRA